MDCKSVRGISVRIPGDALHILRRIALRPLFAIIVTITTVRVVVVLLGRGVGEDSEAVSIYRARFTQNIGPELDCGFDFAVQLSVGALVDKTIRNDSLVSFANLAESTSSRPWPGVAFRSAGTEP